MMTDSATGIYGAEGCISQSSPEEHGQWDVWKNIYKEIYYDERDHVTVEARKSHDLQHRQAGDPGGLMVSFPFEGWQTQDPGWAGSSSPKAGKKPVSQFEGHQAGGILLYLGKGQPFCSLFKPLPDWTRPTHIGEAICFTQPTHLNVNLTQKHSHGNTQDNVWP